MKFCYSFHTMKVSRFVLIATLFLLFFFPTKYAQGSSPQWQSVVEGIEYREFYQLGPNHLFVARMDRNNANLTLETSIAQGRINGGLETVSGMAERYDQALSYWGGSWGARNQVVVAINGYFYDTETGVPWQGQIHSGWYMKRFDDLESGSGFAWKLDRSLFLGGCVVHRPAKQFITHVTTGETIPFDGVNVPREEDELIIYTPQYDASTRSEDTGIEILVELSQPMLIIATPAMTTGTIREIRDGSGSTLIPFDHVVLSAQGSPAEDLRSIFSIGDQIGISQEIKHFKRDCQTPNPFDWSKTYAGTGGSFIFLEDGVLQKFDDLGAILRNARTAIAFDERYVYFIVVADRDPFGNVGMSIVELASFVKNTLGATWGIALDGGSSSTMVVNGEVKNRTDINPDNVEHVVANGVMMVVAQPEDRSTTFGVGDHVRTIGSEATAIRLGPGTNYAAIDFIPPNSRGVIVEHSNQLNGIMAKGAFWWKAAFGSILGWVPEGAIAPLGSP